LYSAAITAGSLKIAESRIVAGLLLQEIDRDQWRSAIVDENVLQSRNPASAIRVSRLIRQRLESMTAEHWRLVVDGDAIVTTHALLAAAVKHSPLLGDFLDLVVREQLRVFSTALTRSLFDEYLRDCRGRDPEMPEWNESTRRKLQTTIYHILVQAGFINDTRQCKLQPVHIADPVLDYLRRQNESYVLRCIEVAK
jgi:hypothetical protein